VKIINKRGDEMKAYLVLMENGSIKDLKFSGKGFDDQVKYVCEEIPADAQSAYVDMKLKEFKTKI
jgi:hypothetical protein